MADTLATTDNAEIIGVTSISDVKRKMHLTGTIIKTSLAGAIVDIGLEVPGVVHISQLKTEPVNKVEDVVKVGERVDVWVRRIDPNKGRIELTMVEPLALEWREIKKDLVITGKVMRLEKFGAFVEIGAERPGLVHISEMTHDYIRNPGEVVKEGDEIEVKVLGVDRRKKKIRLSMKALEEKPIKAAKTALKSKESTGDSSEKETQVPTAMELAIREAMERAQTQKDNEGENEPKRRLVVKKDEMEDILTRTLENRVKTA